MMASKAKCTCALVAPTVTSTWPDRPWPGATPSRASWLASWRLGVDWRNMATTLVVSLAWGLGEMQEASLSTEVSLPASSLAGLGLLLLL